MNNTLINDKEIYDILNLEISRQSDYLELIASENFVSPAVLDAAGSHRRRRRQRPPLRGLRHRGERRRAPPGRPAAGAGGAHHCLQRGDDARSRPISRAESDRSDLIRNGQGQPGDQSVAPRRITRGSRATNGTTLSAWVARHTLDGGTAETPTASLVWFSQN